MTARRLARTALGYVALGGATLFALMPIFWMLTSSLKSSADLFKLPTIWIPNVLHWDNYLVLFEELSFGIYLKNSLVVALVATVVNLLFSSMAGYSLAKFSYFGRSVAFWFVMITLLLPLQVAIVPLYLVVRELGLLDTRAALILPFVATPFGIFLMRQYMLGIPDELLDAARVDGAGELRIFFQIILPLSKPVLAALGIFDFMLNWNNFLWPLVVLQTHDKFTLPLGIALLQGEYSTAFHQLMAAASFASIPILLLYIFLQKNFVNTVMLSGLKG